MGKHFILFLIISTSCTVDQGNLYLVVGGGLVTDNLDQSSGLLSKIQFDIEDRDYYFLTSYSRIDTRLNNELEDLVIRAGLSPYVAPYDDIHAWFIIEWRSMNQGQQMGLDDLTPFLRIFYKNLLFELGQPFNGLTRFNYIFHF